MLKTAAWLEPHCCMFCAWWLFACASRCECDGCVVVVGVLLGCLLLMTAALVFVFVLLLWWWWWWWWCLWHTPWRCGACSDQRATSEVPELHSCVAAVAASDR